MRKLLPFSKADLQDPGQRDVFFVSLSQCASTLSFTFVDIFLPFYIFKVSPYSQRETLLWVGAILGVSGFCFMITSTIWGSLTHRISPKKLFLGGQISNAVVFLLMGFTLDLHLLFLLKMLQGASGGVSTIGLILVSSSSSKDRIASNIGLFQSALTLGQLIGPPLGTLAAATLGYKSSFICGSVLLSAALLLCQLKVTDVPKLPRPAKSETKQPSDQDLPHKHRLIDEGNGHIIDSGSSLVPHSPGLDITVKPLALKGWGLHKQVLAGWIVCFVVQIQILFLPSILPKVLETFHIQGALALKLAGVVVMCYTTTTMIGTLSWTRLTKRIGLVRLATFLLVMGIIFQALLSFTTGVFSFTLIRMLQTGFVAAVIPLVFSIFAGQQKGAVIGFMNSSRFGGGAAGPMLATSIMAVSSLSELCFLISGLNIAALISFRLVFKSEQRTRPANV